MVVNGSFEASVRSPPQINTTHQGWSLLAGSDGADIIGAWLLGRVAPQHDMCKGGLNDVATKKSRQITSTVGIKMFCDSVGIDTFNDRPICRDITSVTRLTHVNTCKSTHKMADDLFAELSGRAVEIASASVPAGGGRASAHRAGGEEHHRAQHPIARN